MDRRQSIILSLLSEYVRSQSLRHLRDQRALAKLSSEMTTALDRDSALWRKWEGPRDTVLSSALDCWIPKPDLLAFLNSLPGPHLTMTDLVQRMRHLIEVDYIATPEPKLKDECLEIYQAEIAAGTEMPARRAADLIHAVFTQICGKITRDITGTGISQRSQFV